MKKKILSIILVSYVFTNCYKNFSKLDIDAIRSEETAVALPIGTINLSPDFFIDKFFTTGDPHDEIYASYKYVDGDSLAYLTVDVPFFGPGFNYGIDGTASETVSISSSDVNSFVTSVNNSSSIQYFGAFSGLGKNTDITFHKNVEIKLLFYNGFNNVISFGYTVYFLDSTQTVLDYIDSPNTNIPANTRDYIVQEISNIPTNTRYLKIENKASFPNGNPTEVTFSKNGKPIEVEEALVQIPLYLEINNLDIIATDYKNNTFLNIYDNYTISNAFIEISKIKDFNDFLLSNLGIRIEFYKEDNGNKIKIDEEIILDIFPTDKNTVSLDQNSITQIEAAEYQRIFIDRIDDTKKVSIKLVKGDAKIYIRFKLEGYIYEEL